MGLFAVYDFSTSWFTRVAQCKRGMGVGQGGRRYVGRPTRSEMRRPLTLALSGSTQLTAGLSTGRGNKAAWAGLVCQRRLGAVKCSIRKRLKTPGCSSVWFRALRLGV